MGILSRLKRLIRPAGLSESQSTVKDLIKSGHLIVGVNSDISMLRIHLTQKISSKFRIQIGADCELRGIFVIMGADANIFIGDRVFIGDNTFIYCREKVTIDSFTLLSWNCTLIDNNSHPMDWTDRKEDVFNWKKGNEYKNWDLVKVNPIHIREKCWIGFQSILLRGVEIGEASVIGAGSVVSKNVDEYTLVAGNPAVQVRKLKN